MILGALLMLGGCASSIMKGFVGQPLQTAMLKYGPPANAFDMGDGTRAFQWSMNSSYVTPTNINNSGNVRPAGNAVWWTQNTQITGGQTINSNCLYTLLARWEDARNSWVVTGFQKPPMMCE